MTASLIVFWLLAASILVTSAVLLLAPLRSRRAARSRADSDVAVYRDQLEELNRDLEGGMIQEAEAQAARVEISRRLLAADAARAGEKTATTRRAAQFAILVVVAMPLIVLPLYLSSGAPGLPAQPFAARISAAPDGSSLEDLMARMEDHLRRNPTDAEGWRVVAPIYGRMGRFDQAVDAFATLVELEGPTAQGLADLGEALVFANQGLVGDRAAAVFNEAVRLDSQNAQARYFLGLAAMQERDTERARAIWEQLLQDAGPDAPWSEVVSRSLAALDAQSGGQPPLQAREQTPQEAIAALPQQQRAAAIESMVEGLDARLRDEGGTEAEWRQLIRARLVLGQEEAARSALNRGVAALAPDAQAAARLIASARDMGLTVDDGVGPATAE